jgi:hypothetical protein
MKARPKGWENAGQLVVTMRERKTVWVEARDAKGNLAESTGEPREKHAAANWLKNATCKAGGLVAVPDDAHLPGVGKTTFAVFRPVAEDDAADITLFCRTPPDLESLDAAQKMAGATTEYEAQLQTTKWRAWLLDLEGALLDADDESQRQSLRRGFAEELDAAATKRGTRACWFAGVLRGSPAK